MDGEYPVDHHMSTDHTLMISADHKRDIRTPIIILAAGSSSRLGRPKQLIKHQGISLIRKTIIECLTADLGEVIVVLGAYYDEISEEIHDLNAQIIRHTQWVDGMGKSISYAARQLDEPSIDGVYIVIADQMHFGSDVLHHMHHHIQHPKEDIIICRYQEGHGPPSYFGVSYLDELKRLNGDSGARSVVRDHPDQVTIVDFELGHIDIDTPEDLLEYDLD